MVTLLCLQSGLGFARTPEVSKIMGQALETTAQKATIHTSEV